MTRKHNFVFSLCPKSYKAICYDRIAEEKKDATKVASKGVSKLTNTYKYDQYLQVVYNHKRFDAVNYTFRVKNDRMSTLRTIKSGLTGTHAKNYVEDDRISIRPHRKHSSQL